MSRGPLADGLPQELYLEVTNRCNLTCQTCPRTFLPLEPAHDLSREEFHLVVGQFPVLRRVVLHGIGEPLLNRDLPAMIRHLKGRGATVLFNSNAVLLTPQWQEALIASGLDEYRVSLDAADAETFHRLRGAPLFGRIVENLAGMVARKRALGRDTPRLSLWFVGMQDNVAELPDFVRLAARLGIDEVYLQRLTYSEPDVPRGLAAEEQALFHHASDREMAIIAECERLADRFDLSFFASGATNPRHSLEAASESKARPWAACRRPWSVAYITANGNVLPCCISPFATADYDCLVLGNVFDQPFADVWNNARYQEHRRRLISDHPPKPCAGCGVRWSL